MIKVTDEVKSVIVDELGLMSMEKLEERLSKSGYKFTYIAIAKTDNTRLSGIPRNKNIENWPSDEYRKEKGVFLKPGKFIKALVPNLSKDELSAAAHRLAQQLVKRADKTSLLKVSDKPSDVYLLHHVEGGSCGGSCMKNQNRHKFDLYDLTEGVEIVYMTDENNRLLARALIHRNVDVMWASDENVEPVIDVMDRIYVNSDSLLPIFLKWAEKNKVYTRASQNSGTTYHFVSPYDGGGVDLFVRKRVSNEPFYVLPYLDTMVFGWKYYPDDGDVERYMSNYSRSLLTNHGIETELRSCDVYSFVDTSRTIRRWCDVCGEPIFEDDELFGVGSQYLCEDCFAEGNYVLCYECGDVHPADELRDVVVDGEERTMCEECIENLSVCVDCGEYTEEDDVKVYSLETDDWLPVCRSCAESSDYDTCPVCDETYKVEDGCQYCEHVNIKNAELTEEFQEAVRTIRKYGFAIKNGIGMWTQYGKIFRLKLTALSNNLLVVEKECLDTGTTDRYSNTCSALYDLEAYNEANWFDPMLKVKIDFLAFDTESLLRYQDIILARQQGEIVISQQEEEEEAA